LEEVRDTAVVGAAAAAAAEEEIIAASLLIDALILGGHLIATTTGGHQDQLSPTIQKVLMPLTLAMVTMITTDMKES
jgi:hypothetical protein